jgi:hypothetical protein
MGNTVKTEQMKSPIVRARFAEVFGKGSEKYPGKYMLTVMVPKNEKAIGLRISAEGKKKMVQEGKAFLKSVKDNMTKLGMKAFDLEEGECDEYGIYNGIKDGDKVNTAKKKKNSKPLAPGYWYMNMSSKFQPVVQRPLKKDGNIDDTTKDEFYDGCWCRVFYNLFTFAVDGNEGVTFGLGNIKKCYDDDAISGGAGGSFADDDDDDIEELEPEDDDFESDAEEAKDEEDPWA